MRAIQDECKGNNTKIVTVHTIPSQQGPFATFKLQYDRTCEWTGLKFSNDGKLILLSTNGGALRILDAFKGAVLHSFGVRDMLLPFTKHVNINCLKNAKL